MADWSNLAVWDLNISKSVLSAGQKVGTMGVGTTYDCAFNAGGREMDVIYECTKFEAPNNAQFVGMATLFRSEDSIECEEVSTNETKITAEFNLKFRGILSPISGLLNGAMQKAGPVVMKDIEGFVGKELGSK